jgi:hypothetical protein
MNAEVTRILAEAIRNRIKGHRKVRASAVAKGNRPQGPKRDPRLRYDNEALWTRIYP